MMLLIHAHNNKSEVSGGSEQFLILEMMIIPIISSLVSSVFQEKVKWPTVSKTNNSPLTKTYVELLCFLELLWLQV